MKYHPLLSPPSPNCLNNGWWYSDLAVNICIFLPVNDAVAVQVKKPDCNFSGVKPSTTQHNVNA